VRQKLTQSLSERPSEAQLAHRYQNGQSYLVAQTIVCAAEKRGKQKQGLAPRETLLPNRDQRQQDCTTPAMLLSCARVYEDTASGGRWDRPELHRLLDHLRDGDMLVVWKLDRLSRSLKDLLHILDRVDAQEASFRSLTEAIDTSGPAGRMMMQMLGCFAEFERAMLQERTRAGLKAARE